MSLLRNKALRGVMTQEIEQVAEQEGVSPEFIRQGVAAGTIVILHNSNRENVSPVAVGQGLRTKVSARLSAKILGAYFYGDQAGFITKFDEK